MRGLLQRLGPRLAPADELSSVVDHLRALLNSRKGQCECVPDYGVIDFHTVAHTMPDGIGTLQRSIQTSIERYEPRLERIHVTKLDNPDPLILRFEIRGRLRSNRRTVRFQTDVHAGGLVEVA